MPVRHVQTRCACGHSVAAHELGPCRGINTFSGETRRKARALELCDCPAAHDTYTVPAAYPALVGA